MKNRLKLDWSLSTSDERTNFINQYIQSEVFESKPPTEQELDTMGNYILWGKNEEGKNIEQEGLAELPRRNATWAAREIESLDELTENPTFNENSIYPLTSKAPTKKVREVFSRSAARKNCPKRLLPEFEALWRRIDETDLLINFYDLRVGKRKKEPRATLLNQFTAAEQAIIQERADNLKQYTYLKLRHMLVESRREQYTLRDTYSTQIASKANQFPTFSDDAITFESDIPVFPFGIIQKDSLIFSRFEDLVPSNFSEEEKKEISCYYWKKKAEKRPVCHIDFTDPENVYQIIFQLEDLANCDDTLFSTTTNLIETLGYYTREANLTDIHKIILALKIKKVRNQDIVLYINMHFGKTYTANYISTIFRQKIIPSINKAAKYHIQLVENLPFEEEFKKCTRCGRILLRDPINFVRKSRSKDGLSNHCKVCDKKERDNKKEN